LRVPHLDRLFYSDHSDRLGLAAGRALIALGPDASPAFPALRNMLGSTVTVGTPTRALWILEKIGAPAVPVLAEAAADPNNDMRLVVIGNLAALGRDATAAVPALTLLLQDTNPFVRNNTARTLAAITGQSITNFNPTPAPSPRSSASITNGVRLR
jgi:HEAT repeat protein